jgi:hypothetical protein
MKYDKVEDIIRRAFEIDAVLPRVKPQTISSILGNMVIIPNDERSHQDVLEDIEHRGEVVLSDDVKLWYNVMTEWMPKLTPVQRKVIELRVKGMGWKRIGKILYDGKISERYLYRTTLWRIYRSGMEDLAKIIG